METQLSFSQLTERQRLVWVSHQLRPEIPLYHVAFSFRIQGALDPERFDRAFKAVVQGVPALRTVLRASAGREARAEVLPHVTPDLVYKDLRAEGMAWKAYIDSVAWEPFNLAGRLFRSWLLRMGEEEFVWLLSIHHIVTDTISFQLIYNRVMAAYRSPDDPRHSDPNPCRADLSEPPDSESAAYWESRLADLPSGVRFYGETDQGDAHPIFGIHRSVHCGRTGAPCAGR